MSASIVTQFDKSANVGYDTSRSYLSSCIAILKGECVSLANPGFSGTSQVQYSVAQITQHIKERFESDDLLQALNRPVGRFW